MMLAGNEFISNSSSHFLFMELLKKGFTLLYVVDIK